MTDPKEKQKPVVKKREPKKVTSTGIFDNLRQIPHVHPVEEFLPPTKDTLGTQSTQSTQTPIAPARDYMKVANSIHRVAVPQGMFKGKCKQIYDFLYSKTRGAIVPSRSVRLTRREIMAGADTGSTKTLFLNMRHLRDVGLITWDELAGSHGGNVYTVYLPEEATQSTLSTLSTQSDSSPKVHRVLRVESTMSTHSTNLGNSTTSEDPKTLIQDLRNDDDEAFAFLVAKLKETAREVTGKETTIADQQRWAEVADVLAIELKIAGARTNVSSAPAFLAEHLRRRLWKKEKGKTNIEPTAERTTATPEATPEQIKACQECGGTGFYYPRGYEGGVAKCHHEKLSLEADTERRASESD